MPSVSVLQQLLPGVEPLRVCLLVLLCSTILALTKTGPVNRFFFFFFWDKFSPSNPGWPGTCLYKPGLSWTHRDNVCLCLSSAKIINTRATWRKASTYIFYILYYIYFPKYNRLDITFKSIWYNLYSMWPNRKGENAWSFVFKLCICLYVGMCIWV